MSSAPPTTNSQVKSDVILSSACTVFRQKGYHGTSIRDIAKAAEFSVPGLYHYFGSKREILFAIMTKVMDDLLDHVADALSGVDDDVKTRLGDLVRAMVVFHAYRADESFVGNTELRSLTEGERAQIIAKRDQVQRQFDAIIIEGSRSGDFTSDFELEASRAIVCMTSAVADWFHFSRGPQTPEQIADRYVTLSLQMLQRSPDSQPLD